MIYAPTKIRLDFQESECSRNVTNMSRIRVDAGEDSSMFNRTGAKKLRALLFNSVVYIKC